MVLCISGMANATDDTKMSFKSYMKTYKNFSIVRARWLDGLGHVVLIFADSF